MVLPSRDLSLPPGWECWPQPSAGPGPWDIMGLVLSGFSCPVSPSCLWLEPVSQFLL